MFRYTHPMVIDKIHHNSLTINSFYKYYVTWVLFSIILFGNRCSYLFSSHQARYISKRNMEKESCIVKAQ